jgi:hypothetical protein
MKTHVILMIALAAVLCAVLPASAALVTDGLVGYYTVDSLTSGTIDTWANSATGDGAWGATTYATTSTSGPFSATVLSSQTPVAGKSAVDLSAGNALFGLTVDGTKGGTYGAYTGMTILTVVKITDTSFYGGIAGTVEDNSIRCGGNTDNAQMLLGNGAVVAGSSNAVAGKWTILVGDMTNGTSGSATVANLYQTDYTTGRPTTYSWTAAASAGSGLFHIYDGENADRFSFGGNMYWYGTPNLCAKSQIAAVLVYNKVLTAEERAASTSALYANFFTTGTNVPEPGSMMALACGLASFAGIAIRRRR